MSNTKFKFTCEEAKRTPIDFVLQQKLGCPPPKQRTDGLWYFSPLRIRKEKTPSLKVNGNRFIDFGADVRSGDVIDLVMRYYRLSFFRALDKLESWSHASGSDTFTATNNNHSAKSSIKVLNICPLNNRILLSYLASRKVNVKIAKLYLEEAHFLIGEQQKRAFALAFKNNDGGYELKNRGFKDQGFKSCIAPKDISVWMGIDGHAKLINDKKECLGCKNLVIFEGLMDFLSCLTYQDKAILNSPALIMNTASNREKTIEFINGSDFENIYYLGDNDDGGDGVLNDLRSSFSDAINIKDSRGIYRGFKDFNDFLTARI